MVIKKKGLWDNINARKKKGISRPTGKSTISDKAYKLMKQGFKKKKKKQVIINISLNWLNLNTGVYNGIFIKSI